VRYPEGSIQETSARLEKPMRNRWIVFLTLMIAAVAVLFAHGEWGGAYVERQKNRLFEANARETLRTINTAAVGYSAEHGTFPSSLEDMGPTGDKLLNYAVSTGATLGYAIHYHSSDSGRSYGVIADPKTRFGRNLYTDQTGVIRVGTNVRAPAYK
jgi:hypothetical protein